MQFRQCTKGLPRSKRLIGRWGPFPRGPSGPGHRVQIRSKKELVPPSLPGGNWTILQGPAC